MSMRRLSQESTNTRLKNIRIYDREQEIDQLNDAYARSHHSCQIMWLYGYSGTGKTTLATTALRSKENFCAAQFNRSSSSHQPFSALADICTKLCYIVEFECIPISLSQDDALLLCRVVPGMAQALDFEPSAKDPFYKVEFGFEKFKKAVQSFIAGACKNLSSPVIIMLDDLQWADVDSLEVIKSLLMDKDVERLLFVGCYRDNMVTEATALTGLFKTVSEESPHRIVSIEVNNLDKTCVNEMVANVISESPSKCEELSDLVFEKTLGNPFYTLQMVRLLEMKDLMYRTSDGKWKWNAESIRWQVDPCDNVLGILSTRLLSMPQETIDVLKVASCFGSEIAIEVLQSLFVLFYPNSESVEVMALLEEAGDLVSFDEEVEQFAFIHHRILDAVYEMIPADERSSMHTDIGRYLWRTISQDYGKAVEQSWQFLHAVEQLNRGRDHIQDPKQRVELAGRNLLAAKKVKRAHAFRLARTFSETGLEFLGGTRWDQQYRLTLELTNILAEVLLSTGSIDECLSLVEEIYDESRTREDCIEAQSVHMDALTCASRLQDCLRIGMTFVESLGHPKIPQRPGQLHHIAAIMRVKAKLRGMSDEDLLSLPSSKEPKKLGISMHLTQLKCVTLCVNEEAFIPIFIGRMMDNILVFGANEWTPHAYCAWAYILTVLGDFKGAARFSRLSIKIMERFREDGSSLTVVAALLNHIRMPLQDCIDPMSKAYDVCCSQGDIAYAGEACVMMCMSRFVAGRDLEKLSQDLFQYCTDFLNRNHILSYKALLFVLRSVLVLTGRPDDIAKAMGKVLNDARFESFLEKTQAGMVLFLFRAFTMTTHFYLGDQEAALEFAEKCWSNNCLKGALVPSVLYFTFSALTAIDAWKNNRKSKYLRHFRQSQHDLRTWVKKGNPNTAHLRLLLDGELSATRANKKPAEIGVMFENSITLALEGGFNHDAALINERAGRYFLQSNPAIAQQYLTKAKDLYSKWGASAKVQQMEHAYCYNGLRRPKVTESTELTLTEIDTSE